MTGWHRARKDLPAPMTTDQCVQRAGHVSQPAQGTQDAMGSESQAAVVLPPVRLVLSVELLRLFDNLKQVITDAKALPGGVPGGPFSGWPSVEPGAISSLHQVRFPCGRVLIVLLEVVACCG